MGLDLNSAGLSKYNQYTLVSHNKSGDNYISKGTAILEKNIVFNLVRSMALLALIILTGTTGYYFIEGWSAFDSLYMTVISLTTVGYGETHPLSFEGKIFTMIFILSAIGSVAYIVGNVSFNFIKLFFGAAIKEKKMEKLLKNIKNHYIICGYGRIGRDVCRNLSRAGKFVLVIDKKPDVFSQKEKMNAPLIVGDASHEEILIKAGISSAAGLISVVNSEAENVFITMTARDINPDLFIISRFEENSTKKKLLRAGADKVINPHKIGGEKISYIILKPTVSKIMDFAQEKSQFHLKVEEMRINDNCSLIGRTIRNSGIRDRFNMIIIAIDKGKNNIIINPNPDYIFEENDCLVIIADQVEIESVIHHYQNN